MASEEKDPYYFRDEISNSDLSWFQKLFLPQEVIYDLEAAYAFGTLIDCMITEPFKVNYFKYTCAGYQHTKEAFALAERMKASFYRDPLCKLMADNSEFQKISIDKNFKITFEGTTIHLPVRCKWDLFSKPKLGMSGDIKSTTATTEKQFITACDYFQYFRQRSFYMDIEGCDKDLLIGISKVNCEVFKVPIVRGGEYYNRGKQQYSELAVSYWSMFGDLKQAI